MLVDVTQYYRPDGRQVTHQLEVSDNCQTKYDELTKLGRLTAEQLMNGSVSQTIECDDFDYDIIITGGADMEKNKEACEKLILRFDKDKCLEMANAQS